MCFPLSLPKVCFCFDKILQKKSLILVKIQVEYFLCCVNLRSGTIFLALAQVLIGLISLLGYVFDTSDDTNEDSDDRNDYIFLTVLTIIVGFLGVILLIGFNKQSLSCFAVYVWAALVVVFIFGIRIFTSFAFYNALAGFNAILIFIICWYILVTINSYYVILFKDRQIFEQETVTSVQAHQSVPLQDGNVKPMNT